RPEAARKDAHPERLAGGGSGPEARKERAREALAGRFVSTRQRKPPLPLTPEKLAAIAALPDVAGVRTYRNGAVRVTAAGAEKPAFGSVAAGSLSDLNTRLIAGRLPSPGSKEVVVSELVLY